MGEITVESTYIETNSEYNQGCALSEYNGEYSITSANEGKDGKKYMQWMFPKTKDGPAKTNLPWQVKLGDLQQAKAVLKQYLNLLGGGEGGENGSDDDIPF